MSGRSLSGFTARALATTAIAAVLGTGAWTALAQTPEDAGSGAPVITLPGQAVPAQAEPDTPAAPRDFAPPVQIEDAPSDTARPDVATEARPAAVERREDAPVEIPSEPVAEWVAGPLSPFDDAPSGSPQRERPARSASQTAADPSSASGLADVGSEGSSALSYGVEDGLESRRDRRQRQIDPAKQTRILALARTLGALHAVRVRCGGRDDQTYRARMATLLDLEAPRGTVIRGEMVSSFNQGFNGQGRGAGPCTEAIEPLEEQLATRGRTLALELAALYRTPPPAPAGAAKTGQRGGPAARDVPAAPAANLPQNTPNP